LPSGASETCILCRAERQSSLCNRAPKRAGKGTGRLLQIIWGWRPGGTCAATGNLAR
jgi:hypothetical protein